MKIIDFFKSLVLPSKMERYRNMSGLFGLIIFVLSTYLLAMPYGNFLVEQTLEYKNEYNFLPLSEIDLDNEANKAIIDEIIALGLNVNSEGVLEYNDTNELEKDRTIVTVKDGITKKIHIFFDFYDKAEDAKIDLTRGFPIASPKEDDANPNPNTVYPYEKNVEEYFLVFTKTNIFYQALQVGIDLADPKYVHNEETLSMIGLNLDYKAHVSDFSLKDLKAEDFGTYVLDSLIEGFSEYARSTSFFQTFLSALLFPLLMVLIFWLFFRKNGRLKRFKEYFNIAAISSIIPILITFAVAWFFSTILSWYIFIFSIYYLFILFKINNSVKEEVQVVQSY